MKTKLFLIPVVILFFGALSMCTKEEENPPATINVRMTDSPGDYQAVYVDVKSVRVHSDETGWVDLKTNAGVYDLIDLSSNKEVLIAYGEIPAGNISQVRLLLGSNNYIVLNNVEIPLTVPSAMESGIKVNIHAYVNPAMPFNLLLDFDAAQSVVLTGSGPYELKPVIRAIVSTTSYGTIKGKVEPAEARPAIIAKTEGCTYSTYANADGEFILKGLPSGVYQVMFFPRAPYPEKTIEDVRVHEGRTIDLGTVYFYYRW